MATLRLLHLLLAFLVWQVCQVEGDELPNTLVEEKKLVMVTTLTRHGSRAPDKILASVSCTPLFQRDVNQSMSKVFVEKFGTIPGELTVFGEGQMRQVGRFIKYRYGKQQLDFINTIDYLRKTTDWEFIARAGSRQQRSMMAIAQGIFPNVAVPIAVTERSTDAVLGGPAPQCGKLTAAMIVDWHAKQGKELVAANYENAVAPFEALCNVSLRDNPVNAAPGGPNPHAWIGDVSDLLDSFKENLPRSKQPPYTQASFDALTKLAFELEQHSHFDDPRGQVMFAGEFPNKLLSTFESIARHEGDSLPKGIPKFRMFACSRELEYGLSHLFSWEKDIRLPDQPEGRVLPGSTIIWELWSIGGKYYVDTMMFQPGVDGITVLQERVSVEEYRKQYMDAIKETGPWNEVCKVDDDGESYGSLFWVILFFFVAIAIGLAYRVGFLRRNEYHPI